MPRLLAVLVTLSGYSNKSAAQKACFKLAAQFAASVDLFERLLVLLPSNYLLLVAQSVRCRRYFVYYIPTLY